MSAIQIKERHIVRAFRNSGAMSAESARIPQDINVATHGAAWRILRNRAIVRDAGEGRFYLDVQSWEADRRSRRKRVLILAILVLAFALWLLKTRH